MAASEVMVSYKVGRQNGCDWLIFDDLLFTRAHAIAYNGPCLSLLPWKSYVSGSPKAFETNEMTQTRAMRALELFELALDQPADLVADFLDRTCDGDAELRADVEAMLAALEQGSDFLPESLGSASASSTAAVPKFVGDYMIVKQAICCQSVRCCRGRVRLHCFFLNV